MPKGKLNTLVAVSLFGAAGLVVHLTGLYARTAFRPAYPQSAASQGLGQSKDKSLGTLRVTVVTPSGGKVGGAALSIGLDGKSADLKALTGEDGAYLSPQLAAGVYGLNVVAACYQHWHGTVRIEPDHKQAINVTLEPASAPAGAAPCATFPKRIDTDVEFSDSTALKPDGISGSVDAGGYSSQAQGPQLRAALGELSGGAGSANDSDAESSVFTRGSSLMLQGDYRQAISVFQQGAAQYPGSNKLLLGLGVAYYSSGRYAEAIDALCKAVDLKPSGRATYFFLAQTYAASPVKTDAVLSRFASYAKSQPQDAAAQYYYALCLWRSRAAGSTSVDAGRVEQVLRAALALDPSLVEAHFQLGVVLAEQHQDAEALAEFERVIALQPGFAEAHYRTAQIYQRAGERDRAEAEIAAYEQLRKQSASGDQKLRDDVRKLLLGSGGTAEN